MQAAQTYPTCNSSKKSKDDLNQNLGYSPNVGNTQTHNVSTAWCHLQLKIETRAEDGSLTVVEFMQPGTHTELRNTVIISYSDIAQQPLDAPHNRTDGLPGMLPTQLTSVYPLAALLWQKLSVSTWSPWPWHIPGSHLAESHPQVAWQSPWLIWASLPRYLHLQLPQTSHFLVVPGPGESYKC